MRPPAVIGIFSSSLYFNWCKQFQKGFVVSEICITKSKFMKSSIFIFIFSAIITLSGCSQNSSQKESTTVADKKIGGSCEGCKVIYESPVPFEKLNWIDTLPDFNEAGPKMMISGVIYKADEKTPAKDVVLYIYHTDQTGHYVNKNNESGWASRQGYIKGWVKTNEKGEYKFYTLKPAVYPERNVPAHIHPVIKEPGIEDYYIDEFLFDDDPLLTDTERKKQENRGGSGIVKLKTINGMLVGERDIILGLNIPGYPVADVRKLKESVFAKEYKWTQMTDNAAFPKSYNFQLFSIRDTLWVLHHAGTWFSTDGSKWLKSPLTNIIKN